ncbi:hypothetical protein D3C71_1300440 [compost metagenome]
MRQRGVEGRLAQAARQRQHTAAAQRAVAGGGRAQRLAELVDELYPLGCILLLFLADELRLRCVPEGRIGQQHVVAQGPVALQEGGDVGLGVGQAQLGKQFVETVVFGHGHG